MVESTMEITSTTESTAKESTPGRTADNIQDSGKMESNMERVLIDKPQVKKRKVTGKMEKE